MIDNNYKVVSYSLTQISLALDVPQHRLIHLCEKNVVIPDVETADGRGSSRRFSDRNVFEFAVALELRRLQLPVALIANLIAVLRQFEQHVARQRRGFELPGALLGRAEPQVELVVEDGSGIEFTLRKGRKTTSLTGLRLTAGSSTRGAAAGKLRAAADGDQKSPKRTRLVVNLSQIAQAVVEALPSS